MGYSTQSKGYRVYNLQTKKLIISRDVEIDENASWNWEEEKVVKSITLVPVQQYQEEAEASGTSSPPPLEDSSLETTPRRVRSLVDIYETCNMAMIEPNCYEEASKQEI